MSISGISNSTSTTDVYSTTSSTQSSTTKKTGNRPEPPSTEQMLSMLSSKLGLNDNQMAEIKTILQKFNASREEEMSTEETQSEEQSAKKAEMDSKMEELNNSIMNVLSDDQKTIFQNMLSSRKPPESDDAENY